MRSMMRNLSGIVLSVLAANAFAGDAAWTLSGPDGGGLRFLQTSAANLNRVYVGSNNALFRSDDAGLTWTRLAANADIGFTVALAVSQTDANVLYAASDKVRKSVDGGNTWITVNVLTLPDPLFAPQDLIIAPGASSTLYLSTRANGLLKSTDAGNTWARIGAATLPAHLGKIAVDPSNTSRLAVAPCHESDLPYAGAPMYRSVDSGASFTAATITGTAAGYFACASALEYSAVTPGLITGFGSDYFRSTDAGANYSVLSLPSSGVGNLTQVSRFLFTSASTIVAGGLSGGLLSSVDAGLSFTFSATAPTFAGASAPLEVFALSNKPGDFNVRYVVTGDGFFRSSDAGASWTRQNVGVRAVNVRAIALNPLAASNTFYVGYSDGAGQSRPFYRSTNAGAIWADVGNNIDADWFRTILLDTNTVALANQVLYAGGRDISPQRQPRLRGTPVYKSMDGGTNWLPLTSFAGLAPPPAASNPIALGNLGTVRAIVPDKLVTSGGLWSKLYLTASGAGNCSAIGGAVTLTGPRIWRTLDAGSNWNTISTAGSGTSGAVGTDGLPTGSCIDSFGFPQADYPIPVPLLVDPVDGNTLYVGTYLRFYNEASGYIPSAANGIFKSTDGGITWVQRSTGLPRYAGSSASAHAVLALVMDPSNRNILYAASNPFDSSAASGNVYKSIDAGLNWAIAGTGLAGQDIRGLLIDPDNTLRIYAASGGNALNPGAVFVSENGGLTWNSISAGLPTGSATALALKGNTLYAGTRFGLAEFTRILDGDGDGAPNGEEGASSPTGDGNGDGIADAQQANVAANALTGASRSTLGRTNYILASTGVGGSCNQLYDVVSVPATSFGIDAAFERKALGAFRFEIAGCTEATIRLNLPDGGLQRNMTIRSFGPATQGSASSFQWNTLPASLSADGRTLTFTLRDNQLGDARGDSNRILFQGGPAAELIQDGFE
jgi:photosystem II stability/assembly factor-like uncharacterized protein